VFRPSHEEVFRLARQLYRGPSLEPDELLDIVRLKFSKLSQDDIELVAAELEEKIGQVDPSKQKLTHALALADASPPPSEAAKYPQRPHLRRFIALIHMLEINKEGAYVIAQAPFAELLGVSRQVVAIMIHRLIRDGLLAVHTQADHKRRLATTYILRPEA